MSVTRAHLVNRMALATGKPKAELDRVVTRFLDELAAALAEEGRVELRDFGVFNVTVRKAHTTTHPRTGEPLEVSARRHVSFRTGKALTERLNPHSQEDE